MTKERRKGLGVTELAGLSIDIRIVIDHVTLRNGLLRRGIHGGLTEKVNDIIMIYLKFISHRQGFLGFWGFGVLGSGCVSLDVWDGVQRRAGV